MHATKPQRTAGGSVRKHPTCRSAQTNRFTAEVFRFTGPQRDAGPKASPCTAPRGDCVSSPVPSSCWDEDAPPPPPGAMLLYEVMVQVTTSTITIHTTITTIWVMKCQRERNTAGDLLQDFPRLHRHHVEVTLCAESGVKSAPRYWVDLLRRLRGRPRWWSW